MMMVKSKTIKDAILETWSWKEFKKEAKVALKEIGEYILFALAMIYFFKVFGLLV
jgi:hypothetical protein